MAPLLFFLVIIATTIGAILRPVVGRWVDARNIAQLRRHYHLDEAMAEQLYRLARRDGFGSAWETVVRDRRVDERRRVEGRRLTRRTTDRRGSEDRRIAGRNRA